MAGEHLETGERQGGANLVLAEAILREAGRPARAAAAAGETGVEPVYHEAPQEVVVRNAQDEHPAGLEDAVRLREQLLGTPLVVLDDTERQHRIDRTCPQRDPEEVAQREVESRARRSGEGKSLVTAVDADHPVAEPTEIERPLPRPAAGVDDHSVARGVLEHQAVNELVGAVVRRDTGALEPPRRLAPLDGGERAVQVEFEAHRVDAPVVTADSRAPAAAPRCRGRVSPAQPVPQGRGVRAPARGPTFPAASTAMVSQRPSSAALSGPPSPPAPSGPRPATQEIVPAPGMASSPAHAAMRARRSALQPADHRGAAPPTVTRMSPPPPVPR